MTERTPSAPIALALVAALALGGCVARAPRAACPAGQAEVRTAQLYLAKPTRTGGDLAAFIAHEVTPRFPDGVTLLRGGEVLKAEADPAVRNAANVLVLVLPSREAGRRLKAVRAAYGAVFGAGSTLVTPPPTCQPL